MDINKYRLKNTNRYLIACPENFTSEDKFLDAIANELQKGIDIIELDGQNCNDRKILQYGKKVRELCSIYNAIFILRSRSDIAHILNADGINLDKNDIDLKSAKHLLGDKCIAGYRAYTKEEINLCANEGFDYISLFLEFDSKDLTDLFIPTNLISFHYNLNKNENHRQITILK